MFLLLLLVAFGPLSGWGVCQSFLDTGVLFEIPLYDPLSFTPALPYSMETSLAAVSKPAPFNFVAGGFDLSVDRGHVSSTGKWLLRLVTRMAPSPRYYATAVIHGSGHFPSFCRFVLVDVFDESTWLEGPAMPVDPVKMTKFAGARLSVNLHDVVWDVRGPNSGPFPAQTALPLSLSADLVLYAAGLECGDTKAASIPIPFGPIMDFTLKELEICSGYYEPPIDDTTTTTTTTTTATTATTSAAQNVTTALVNGTVVGPVKDTVQTTTSEALATTSQGPVAAPAANTLIAGFELWVWLLAVGGFLLALCIFVAVIVHTFCRRKKRSGAGGSGRGRRRRGETRAGGGGRQLVERERSGRGSSGGSRRGTMARSRRGTAMNRFPQTTEYHSARGAAAAAATAASLHLPPGHPPTPQPISAGYSSALSQQQQEQSTGVGLQHSNESFGVPVAMNTVDGSEYGQLTLRPKDDDMLPDYPSPPARISQTMSSMGNPTASSTQLVKRAW